MEFSDIKLLDHPLVYKAYEMARKSHEDQNRFTSSGRKIPYITHPVKVAEIIERTMDDYDPALIAAALVHDLVEDTDVELEDIRTELGDEVAQLVGTVSVEDGVKGSARREFQVKNVEAASDKAQILKVADRLANLMSISFDPPEHWSVVNRFNYFKSSEELIHAAKTKSPKLNSLSNDILEIAERSVFVAIRERIRDKGTSNGKWKGLDYDIKDYFRRAESDIEKRETLFDDQNRPVQSMDNLDSLYTEAAIAHRELGNVVTYLADFIGAEAVVPDKLKERDRAQEVIDVRFDGDVRRLNDVARVALVCKTMDQARMALHMLSQSHKIVEVTDRFTNPNMCAYRDLHLVTRSDRSHFCEVQIHLRHLWDAKKYKGDELYCKQREICSIKKDDMTPELRKEKRKIFDKMRQLYKEAAEKHGFTDHKPVSGNEPFRPRHLQLPEEMIAPVDQEENVGAEPAPILERSL